VKVYHCLIALSIVTAHHTKASSLLQGAVARGKFDQTIEQLEDIFFASTTLVESKAGVTLSSTDKSYSRARKKTKDELKKMPLLYQAQFEALSLLHPTPVEEAPSSITQAQTREIVSSFHSKKIELPFSTLDYVFGLDYQKVEDEISEKAHAQKTDAYVGGRRSWSQSSYELIREVLSSLNMKPGNVVYDLGSGYGRLGLYGAFLFPKATFIGVEYVMERAKENSRVIKSLGLNNAEVITKDVLEVDLSRGNFFYFYNPFPSLMPKVLKRIQKISEKKSICLIGMGPSYFDVKETSWLTKIAEYKHPVKGGLFCSKKR
jgi:hypothetical protein